MERIFRIGSLFRARRGPLHTDLMLPQSSTSNRYFAREAAKKEMEEEMEEEMEIEMENNSSCEQGIGRMFSMYPAVVFFAVSRFACKNGR